MPTDGSSPGSGTLYDNTTDWYSFTAHKGDRLLIDVQGGNSIVTLFAADEATVFGSNVRPFPLINYGPLLFVTAPADGTYFFRLESYEKVYGTPYNGPVDYQVWVFPLPALPIEGHATAANGSIAIAKAISYASSPGLPSVLAPFSRLKVLDGSFGAANETHVFAFTPPAGTKASTQFYFQPIGADGDGSTASVKAWITDGAGTILSRADQSNYTMFSSATPLELFAPVKSGSPYYLFVQNTGGATETDYYYAVQSFDYDGNQDESTTAHGTAATAQVMQGSANIRVDGTLSAPGEADWYTFDPAGGTLAEVSCVAAREGSGLQGFTVSVYAADGTTLLRAPATESSTGDIYERDIALPVGSRSKIYVKLTATGQDAAVTGRFYGCSMAAYGSP